MRTISLFFLLIFLPSCYGYHVMEEFMPLEPVDCVVHPEEVFLFFNGESTSFPYQRIGTITITGNHHTRYEEALNRLKVQASNHCANAIIGIQVSQASRAAGTYMDRDEYQYEARMVTGLAVRVVRDSAFNARYGHLAKSDFRKKVDASQAANSKRDENALLWSLVLISTLLVFMIAVDAAVAD